MTCKTPGHDERHEAINDSLAVLAGYFSLAVGDLERLDQLTVATAFCALRYRHTCAAERRTPELEEFLEFCKVAFTSTKIVKAN